MAGPTPDDLAGEASADWQRRVVDRSLRSAAARSVDRVAITGTVDEVRDQIDEVEAAYLASAPSAPEP